jgi:DNA-binding transcriptional LysR family regulator
MLLTNDIISNQRWGAVMQLSDRIGRRMKLQDLHVLMTVVQAGSMGKAAQYLNTTQPNISRSIADLEHALGVRLLDRHRQGIEPTQYGRALLDGGVAAFDQLRQAVKNIEFLADPATGEVRIGCQPFLAPSFISAVINRLSRSYSRIVFHVVDAEADALHRQLRERNVDLLIARRFGPIADDELEFETLYDDSLVVVAGVQNPWVKRRNVELSELVNEPWALPLPTSAFGAVAIEAFRSSGLDYPRTTVFTGHTELRARLLATGRFLTIFSSFILGFPTKRTSLKALPVELPLARTPVGIVTLKNRTLSPVVSLFIEHAREVARPEAT